MYTRGIQCLSWNPCHKSKWFVIEVVQECRGWTPEEPPPSEDEYLTLESRTLFRKVRSLKAQRSVCASVCTSSWKGNCILMQLLLRFPFVSLISFYDTGEESASIPLRNNLFYLWWDNLSSDASLVCILFGTFSNSYCPLYHAVWPICLKGNFPLLLLLPAQIYYPSKHFQGSFFPPYFQILFFLGLNTFLPYLKFAAEALKWLHVLNLELIREKVFPILTVICYGL